MKTLKTGFMETIQHIPTAVIYGAIFCIMGLWACYQIGRRRFNRRGIGGLQHYNNYGEALITGTIEKMIKLIAIAAIVIGGLLIITNHPQTTQNVKEKSKINNPTKSNKHGN